MTTLAEFMIIAGANNRPPMLEKFMYDSWKSRMELYIENRENMRMVLNSILNGPLVWPTVAQEDGTTMTKKYEELSVFEKLQAVYDLKAINIVLQGLLPDVYTIVNHHKVAKDIWDGATIQDDRVTMQQVQGRQGQSYAGTGYKGNATSFGGNNVGGQSRFKDKEMFAEAQESGHILDEEQLVFLTDPGIPDGQATQTTIPNNSAFQIEDLDAYNFDCDDVFTTQAVLMTNLSNYGSDVISEVPYFEPYHHDMDNQSGHAMQDFEQTLVVDFTDNEITSDSNIIPYSQYLQKTQQEVVQDTNFVISSQHVVIPVIDDEETLILEEVSQSKMLAKQNDPILKEKKINTTPINYVELNRLSEDFGKRFVPQQELSDEQAFWLQTSHPNTDQSDISPVKIEAPRELPKGSLVNTSLKKLKYHLGKFDTMVKKQITPDAITKGEWGLNTLKLFF
ncbi:hypothetical protein Tco_0877077 [Tanacetum coccineum]|uniref:Integrase, catalytic region, zinc finger, CCHC-type, peptidase aspartic, catalytic n=1 Tax=Tanacetum coccineum TaxID=301880 RepID=A0ABQ5BUC3_9ASTR